MARINKFEKSCDRGAYWCSRGRMSIKYCVPTIESAGTAVAQEGEQLKRSLSLIIPNYSNYANYVP